MKRILMIAVMLACTTLLYGQPKRVLLTIQSGISVPLFDFASTELGKGCFTLPGFTGSLETQLVINEKWYGVVQGGIQLNPVDVGLLGYEKMQADPFLQSMYIRSDPFRVIHLMAGPGYLRHLGEFFTLEGQLTAGVFFSSTPYQLHKTEYFLTGPPFYEITASKDVSFAYGAGIRLVYDLTPCYQLGISSQYLQSRASYNFTTGSGIRTDIRNISLWNTSLALIVKLF
ncbi:MAG: hypothetical protein FD166_2947 [Bacteroidetes bacterium]|nr:MAG: hypothetical protein FD166_2947 [Bacteroidota bacterium]